MTTEPLDLENLLRELDDPEREPFEGLPGEPSWATSISRSPTSQTLRFYRDVLGFDEMATLGSQATFLSAAAPPRRRQHAGERGSLRRRLAGSASYARTVVLPDSASRDEVVGRVAATGQDPEETPEGPSSTSGNRLLLA